MLNLSLDLTLPPEPQPSSERDLSKIMAVGGKPLHGFLESFPERLLRLKAKELLGPADIFKPPMWHVRILIDGIDAPRIERTRPPNNAVDLIALPEKKLCQIRSILPGNPGDQRLFHKLFLHFVGNGQIMA